MFTRRRGLWAHQEEGWGSIYLFRFFNAMVAQIMLGAPIVVYAKLLGASSVVLGGLAALSPLMSIVQPRAVLLIPRVGYQNLVLISMGLVTFMVMMITAIPVLLSGENLATLFILAICLCLFNACRYVSYAAFVPWVTALVPTRRLGFFVSWEQLSKNFGCLCALFVAAWVAIGRVDDWGFATVFAVGALGGGMSIYFVRRIPDVKAEEVVRRSSHLVSRKAMLCCSNFRPLVILNFAVISITGTLEVFAVEYLREIPSFSISMVLSLSGLAFAAALLSLPFCGRVVDRVGSKPVMVASLALFCFVLLGWFLTASDVLPSALWVVACLTFLTGLAQSNYLMANMRLLMAVTPEVGRNHFLAFFSLAMALGSSATLVAWGGLLDLFGYCETQIGIFCLRRHSYYFLGLLVIAILSLGLLPAVRECRSQDV